MTTSQVAIRPYYVDEWVTLYQGDCRRILPLIPERPTVCVTDPPYEETSNTWDVWQDGWVSAVANRLPYNTSIWCFGTAKMFLTHVNEFTNAGLKYSQEALWVKRNGSGPTHKSRLVRIHEWAYQWYRGPWSTLHHAWEREPYTGPDKSVHRIAQPAHQNIHKPSTYVDDGTRQPRSVTFVIEEPSVRYQKRHRAEKPEAVVKALVRECAPVGGGPVLDCFAGSGTTGVVAKQLGIPAVLIEGDPTMCAVIVDRLREVRR